MTSPLVGYSYIQAISLYGEASKTALVTPQLTGGLDPFDGVIIRADLAVSIRRRSNNFRGQRVRCASAIVPDTFAFLRTARCKGRCGTARVATR